MLKKKGGGGCYKPMESTLSLIRPANIYYPHSIENSVDKGIKQLTWENSPYFFLAEIVFVGKADINDNDNGNKIIVIKNNF